MHINKPVQNDRNRKAISGIDKHLAKVKSLPLDGTPTAIAEMKQILRDATDASTAADAARAEWSQRVAHARATHASATSVLRALQSYLLVHYGAGAVAILEDFGFSAPKAPGRKSVRTKAAAVDKSLATRGARHTMGSKQKERIKGEAPAPPILPPAPAAAPGTPVNGSANGAIQ
jgi:hypothetical protein